MKYTRWRMWFPAALALGVAVASVTSSACFTPMVMDAAKGREQRETVSLRVRQCYLNPQGRLIVAANGGNTAGNPAATPHDAVWFAADLPALVAAAKSKAIILPRATLQSGAPDPEMLHNGEFVEIPFVEYPGSGERSPRRPPAARPNVDVHYSGMFSADNYTDQLGRAPVFVIRQAPEEAPVNIQIYDTHRDSNPAALLLLPVALAGDAVVVPITLVLGAGSAVTGH